MEERQKEWGQKIISRIDANGSGEASWEETQAKAISQFGELDLDHDGRISPEEYGKFSPLISIGPAAPPEPMAMFDDNKDGFLTKAEFIAMYDRRFSMLDRNRDGLLTEDDFINSDTKGPPGGGPAGGMGGMGGMGGGGPMGGGSMGGAPGGMSGGW